MCKCLQNKVFVIVTYSFDKDTPIYPFDTEEDAAAFIRKDFENECHTDDENGYTPDNAERYIESDGSYARITNLAKDGSHDTTEWRIGQIKDQP